MLEWDALLPLIATLLAAGAASGLLAGLLGVGGGIVMVPVLDTALASMGTDASVRMQIAVATSLATIVPTALSSARAHYRRGAVDQNLLPVWAPLIVVGALLGSVVASNINGQSLALMFGVLALLVALKLVLPLDHVKFSETVPRTAAVSLVPFSIGGLSSMLGIGGGTLSVPALTLMGESMHRAVGTAAVFGFVIAVPGTLGFIVTGWGDPRLPPGSLGYVNLLGFACFAPVTVLVAPLGARLAHRLDKRHLSVAFGCFLLIVAVRMLSRGL